MGSQRFCLRWNNHQTNLLSVFDQLLQDEAFVDVTLAVDGQFLKAHKMVLSACSPYFQALFVGHPDKHPIVILKDVPFSDMRSLLDFMYRGEVSVDQDRLTAFLKVAESLRIKGLTEVNDERCDLPSIANSLLNSPHPLKPPPPPPPPNLHRIPPQGMQMNMPHQSPNSPHHMGSNQLHSSKRPLHQQHHHQLFAGNALLNSGLHGPKRKRGRPRKLSGSSPGRPDMEHEDSRMNSVDNHMSVMMGEHLVVKAVAPGTALSKQLTILNAHHPSSPHHPNVERCSPHPMLTPGEHGTGGSPAVTPRRTESSEPASPANATPATDIDDVEEEAIDEDEDGIAGDHGSPEPEHQNETEEYNNQPFKSEGDPKPSTSGHENSSPYRQQQNQPSNQHQNSADSPANQFPSPVVEPQVNQKLRPSGEIVPKKRTRSFCGDVKDEPLDDSEQSQDSDLTPGDYEDMIACSPASSDCDDEAFEASEESKAKLAAEAGDSPSKPSSVPEAEIIDDDITQIEQDSFSSLMNPTSKAPTTRSANSGRSRRLDKLSIRRYCTREGNHMYRCNVCSKTYTHISNFCRHFLSAHCGYKQDIQCPVCLKAFTRKDNMMTHAKQVHGVSVGKGGAAAAGAGDSAEQRSDGAQ